MGFLSRGKFTPALKSGDASNFIQTLDGIGLLTKFQKSWTTKDRKVADNPVEGLVKLFS